MTDAQIVIRKCAAIDDYHACVELQRAVWGETDLETAPISMFILASRTGGQVLGAFDGGRLVGFTLAFVGWRAGKILLHSHMTGIDPAYRNRGIATKLKRFQREQALSRGIGLIVWTFDPLLPLNANFNLNRLGAICREYIPDSYGITTSPLHRGLPTDRLLAEWHLDSARVLSALARVDQASAHTPEHPQTGSPTEKPASAPPAIIELPAIPAPHASSAHSKIFADSILAAQALLRKQFSERFSQGYAALQFRTAPSPAYLLWPWSASVRAKSNDEN
ncbi:MAG: hypothetical protein NVS9B4_24740 [Candidatus Acidiferrum sp.]